ncbi:MAG: pentapeptide repeat-containing protein, partial [Planctomycetota bacterium]
LSRANLRGATLLGTCLKDANLFGANLEEAECSGADFTGALLRGVRAQRAGFGMAQLEGASFALAELEGASFTSANLNGADFSGVRARSVRFSNADLCGARFEAADLQEADLSDAQVSGATFRRSDLRNASLRGVRGYTSADWIDVDVRDTNFSGAHLCRRYILDQNYLQEFKSQGTFAKIVYWIWFATSDCGRSLLRWALWTIALASAFGALYTQVHIEYANEETWLSPFYFSVVTLTTLGYGDAVPVGAAAQSIAMMEVVLGYMMLGGVLSIFSNKMARRAD